MLRCEVFVDVVARVEILTTTRVMYRDDVEVVEVQAFDSEGTAHPPSLLPSHRHPS